MPGTIFAEHQWLEDDEIYSILLGFGLFSGCEHGSLRVLRRYVRKPLDLKSLVVYIKTYILPGKHSVPVF